MRCARKSIQFVDGKTQLNQSLTEKSWQINKHEIEIRAANSFMRISQKIEEKKITLMCK